MAVTAPGSPYVESSDLVANYPGVSESLAERVDLVGVLPFADSTARGTALPSPTDGQYSYLQDTNATEYYNGSAWVAAGVAPGLVHINTTTFSAVSSVSLNNVFSSDYDNYRVILTGAGSGSLIVTARLRVGGTDNTGANFDRQRLYINGSGVTGTRYNSQTDFALGGFDTPDRGLVTFDVFRPFLTTSTLFNVMNSWPASGGEPIMFIGVGSNSLTTSFDGFTLIASAGTMTGTVRVYGYKNS